MADYFPLIARAVQALPEQSPELRGAVYDRAREALIGQLRSLDPPLSEEEIAEEAVSLDAAIAEVEAAYAPEQEPEPETGIETASFAPEPEPRAFVPQPEPAPQPQAVESAPASRPAEPPRAAPPETDLPEALPAEPGRAGESVSRADASRTKAPQAKARPRLGAVAPRAETGSGLRMAVVVASIAVVIGAIAFAAYFLTAGSDDSAAPAPQPVAQAPVVDEEGKIAERIEAAPAPAGETAPPAGTVAPADGVAVTQRAILYEEDPVNPQGEPRAAGGGAVWMLDPPPGGTGDPSVRAVVDVPDAGLTMTMVMRRNLDATLPASHTIELIFATTGREGRTVRDIGLLQLKEEEVVRGAPIAGLPVPVQDNLFLIGLSNVAADTQRNRNLLTQRNWIDIPIRFSNGQRAIVSFEKGVSGEQAFARAFEAWDR